MKFANPGPTRGQKHGPQQTRGYSAWLTDVSGSERRLTADSLGGAASKFVERYVEPCDFGTEISVTVVALLAPERAHVFLVRVSATSGQVGVYDLPGPP